VYGVSKSVEKIEVFSNEGKNKIYIQANIGPRGLLLRVYAEIESMNTNDIKLSNVPSSMALAIPRYPYQTYSAGGELLFFGKVRTFNILVGLKTNESVGLILNSNIFKNLITPDEARIIACNESKRVNFIFEVDRDEQFSEPQITSKEEFIFHGYDVSGDCGISVYVNRQTGSVHSKVKCD